MSIYRKGLAFSITLVAWSLLPVNLPTSSASAPIYTYTDDSGTPTFTTDWESIPEKYRSHTVLLDLESSPSKPAPATPALSDPAPSPREPSSSAKVRVVTATGEYRMGDHDTRADAVQLAVEAAKRQALEQVATYLESVTEVRDMDVTRDDIRTYTAGVVTVLNQNITTRLEGDTVVIAAELTAEVDPNEVIQAITALRENESAKHELAALRAETDQLHQQLDAANQALATAVSADQVQALNQERHEVLTQLQSNAYVTQAWTNWVYVGPIARPYPWIRTQHVNGLLLHAQQLAPQNRHLPMMQQAVAAQSGSLPSTPPPGVSPPVTPPSSLLVPPSASQRVSPRPHSSESAGSPSMPHATSPQSTSAPPRGTPLSPPIVQQTQPRLVQPNVPMLRGPSSMAPRSPSLGPRHFGGSRGGYLGGGHRGGGGHFGGGGRGGGGRGR